MWSTQMVLESSNIIFMVNLVYELMGFILQVKFNKNQISSNSIFILSEERQSI